MKIDGKLWNRAKDSLGTRNSRKRMAKSKGGVSARTRIMEKYLEMAKEIKSGRKI